jgi:hypothetical protein
MRFLRSNRTDKPLIALAASIALALTSLMPATAADGEAPFRARISGTAAFTSPTNVEFHGAGHATHLGKFASSGVAILGHPSETCPGGALGIPNVHTETLTAANGDELVIRMENVGCPTGPYTFHGTGNWSVLSGTGRFEGASGQGTNEGNADFESNTFQLLLTGTLSRPAGAAALVRTRC